MRPRSCSRPAGGDAAAITGPLVTAAAQAGDAVRASRDCAELGDWIGQGVATLAAVLDPNVVVIGGGVSEAGDLLLDPIRASFASHVTGRWAPADARDPPGRSSATPAAWSASADLARRR